MKFRVLWDVAPCSHVEFDRRFRDAYCNIWAMMEAVRTSETSVNFNVTTRRYISEDYKKECIFYGIQCDLKVSVQCKFFFQGHKYCVPYYYGEEIFLYPLL
jgi:hypothetical protein